MLSPVALAIGVLRVWSEASLLFQFNALLGRLVHPRLPRSTSATTRDGPGKEEAVKTAEQILLRSAVSTATTLQHAFVPVNSASHVLHTVIATRPALSRPCSLPQSMSVEDRAVSDVSTAEEVAVSDLVGLVARSKRPLVLLHGHGMCASMWAPNFDAFLEDGYDCILAPDLLGWGRSSRPRFDQLSSAESGLSFYLDALDDWLGTVLRNTSFALAGHSLGGHLSHEFALRHATRVNRLILISPAAILRKIPLGQACWYAATPQRMMQRGGLIAMLAFASKYPTDACYNIPGIRQLILYSWALASGSGDAAAASFVRFIPEETSVLSASSSSSSKASHSRPPSPAPGPTAVYAIPSKELPREKRSRSPLKRRAWHAYLLLSLRRWRAECARPLLDRVTSYPYPVELVAGDRDALVNVEAVRALHRAMRAAGNTVRLSVVHGGDHSPQLSAPDRFAKAVSRGAPGACAFRPGHRRR